jgi:hypothetical protein
VGHRALAIRNLSGATGSLCASLTPITHASSTALLQSLQPSASIRLVLAIFGVVIITAHGT